MARKDKNTAAFISLVFGWFGMHQIYLKKPVRAIFFIAALLMVKPVLLGFFVAAMMGFVNALVLMMMPQERFDQVYNRGTPSKQPWDRKRDYSRRDYDREQRWERRQQSRTNAPRRTARPTPTTRPGSVQGTIRNVRPAQPRKPNPFKISGVKRYKDYDYEEAIKDFNKALEIEPKDIATHFNIACAYSLTENPALSFQHLHKAVVLGFNDFEKIKTHDDLAFLRIQPEFEKFKENNFLLSEQEATKAPAEDKAPDDVLLGQLNKLAELREKGLITEEEYVQEKRKLTN